MVDFVIIAGCLENGDIVLFGLHENSQLLSHGACTQQTTGKDRNYHKILTNCGNITVHALF